MVANNYFIIMFAYEIKFYKYTSPKEESHFGSMTEETYVPLETIIATDPIIFATGSGMPTTCSLDGPPSLKSEMPQ